MDCIILLFLLGCCGGWGNNGNGCRGNSGGNGCGQNRGGADGRGRNRGETCGCRESRERVDDCGCGQNLERTDDCGCGNESLRYNRDENRGDARTDGESCAVPGMIPPPWQEYPGFPHRDSQDDCD